MKLISMIDFVLERKEVWRNISMKSLSSEQTCRAKHSEECEQYANFLKQLLELWMFVPTDEEGNVLSPVLKPDTKPNEVFGLSETETANTMGYNQYQKAKERVLFEHPFYTIERENYQVVMADVHSPIWLSWNDLKTIETLIQYGYELTPTALKQIGHGKDT